jgi:hypothetical protein
VGGEPVGGRPVMEVACVEQRDRDVHVQKGDVSRNPRLCRNLSVFISKSGKFGRENRENLPHGMFGGSGLHPRKRLRAARPARPRPRRPRRGASTGTVPAPAVRDGAITT